MIAILRYIKRGVLKRLNAFFYSISRIIHIYSAENMDQFQQRLLLNGSNPETPLDLFVLQNFIFNDIGHFSKSYQEFRMRRISKILEIFGVDFFKGKKILELGGGVGDIGAFFASLGADVVSADYRITNRNLAAIRYRNVPGFKSVFFDGEKDFTDLCRYAGPDGKFDMILCLAFLEVIEKTDNVILCSMKLSNNIILETMVCDSVDPQAQFYIDMPVWKGYNDHSISEKVPRPSPAYIENVFTKNGWGLDRFFSADLNTASFCFDWTHKNDGCAIRDGKRLRRFWHFKSQ